MARALITLIFALLVSAVVGIPTRQFKKRSFKVHRIENKNYVADGTMAMKRAYLKYGLPVGDIEAKPEGEVATNVKAAADNSNTGTENGETAAKGTQNDAQFLSPIKIAGQEMIVNFDTGSSDLWVFNTNLNTQQRGKHTVYDPTQSKTFKASQNKFSISYGDGSFANGPVGFDTVDIGGSTVESQAIGLPNNVSAAFTQDTSSNGLVGLAFSKLNTVTPKKQNTFFDNVAADLSQPLFTAQLKGGTVGAYEFGIIDTSAFIGELAQVPVDNSRGFWEFKSNKVTVNGNTTQIKGTAIADTGTSLMLVGDDMLEAYWNQVDGAQLMSGKVVFPCDAKLPDLEVAAGDTYMAKVPGENMNFANFATVGGVKMCFGGLQSNGGIPFSIYGDVWFKSQFVSFQADGPSLGLAPHA